MARNSAPPSSGSSARSPDPKLAFGGIALLVLATRLCHLRIVWVEEAYPSAAAFEMLAGKVIYRDFWFDKPPLFPLVYTLWGGYTGWPLRLAGTLFVLAACWTVYRFARELWGASEGLLAAFLLAFSLTFWIPSAVMSLTPDLLMIVPHLIAVFLAWRGKAFWSGFVAGACLLINSKGVFVALACLLWLWRSPLPFAAGLLVPNAAALLLLPASRYLEQVWQWGWIYSRDTFIESPIREGVLRTLNWAGFHGALVAGALVCWWKERSRLMPWALISLVAVAAGWRFFPRYYFQLLPVMVLAGARGLMLLAPRWRAAVLFLLVVPLARFGPRYVMLAAGQESDWSDLAMHMDSREAVSKLQAAAGPGDTLLVWGYRPDIFAGARMLAGTPFLDSQPLTGVIADRHLTDSRSSAPDLAARNRKLLTQYHPSFIVDGLGPYNPALAITRYAGLAAWLADYEVFATTRHCVLYRLRHKEGPAP